MTGDRGPDADAPTAADPDQGLAQSTFIVGIGTALSRLSGLAKLGVVAYVLGFTRLTDVYNLANTTPNILYELALGGVLTAALVPFFVDRLDRRDHAAISTLVFTTGIALVAVTAATIVSAPWVARLYTLNVDEAGLGEQRKLITALLRWFAPQILFYGLVALSTAMLHARRRFAAAAIAPVLNNLAVMGALIALHASADGPLTVASVLDRPLLVAVLGAGTSAGILAMALATVGAFRSSGIRWVRPRLHHPVLGEIARLSGWSAGYVASNQVALWVVLVLAAQHAGDLSAYQTAFVFFQLPHGLLAVSLMTTFAPGLATRARDSAALREHFSSGLRLLLLLTAPAAAGYLVLSGPVVQTLLERGALTGASAERTAHVLTALAVGLVPFSAYLYTLRGFYAMRDARTPFLVNAGENAVNIGLALALAPAFEATGLALSYAIAYCLAAGVALVLFARRVGGLDPAVFHTAARAGACAAVMAVAVAATQALLEKQRVEVRALAGVATGVMVYGGLLLTTARGEISRLIPRSDAREAPA